MANKKYTLSKEERLSWKRYIDLLFEKGQSFIAFPLRVVYLPIDHAMPSPVTMMVSVSKKKFKRAVKRNAIKRQMRETYRLNKCELTEPLKEKNRSILVAFIYLDKKEYIFPEMEKAMKKALRVLGEKEL
ncbi:MAG: ribonuclease P protein component [Tannerellaceae bacterium]|nr:ribonuclease P protein component [Tannerellaceae bacterium]MCD8263280.1 ribonuclease P protein component [Tannerellaceae bacterium]